MRKKSVVTDQSGGYDPHASTVDPDDPRLKVARRKGRSIRKGPVAGVVGVVVGLLMLAVSLALLPREKARRETERRAPGAAERFAIPDMIRNAPDNDDPLLVEEPVDELSAGELLPSEEESFTEDSLPVSGSYVASSGIDSGADQDQDAYDRALEASPFFQGAGEMSPMSGMVAQGRGGDGLSGGLSDLRDLMGATQVPQGLFGEEDPNRQGHKDDFMAGEGGARHGVVAGDVVYPSSPFEIKAGSIIPVSLVTGIDSDLPGEIIGQVREHVYDSVTGRYLLIPQGSRLLARYDSMVSYGQRRALVCWNRLIRPDGSSIDLGCAPGVGLDGYAGFGDRVDNHFDRLVGGVLLSSVLSVGTTMSQGEWDGHDDRTAGQLFAANAGEEINRAGQQITRKNLGIQPTIKVRPGYSVNVLVNRDLTLGPVGEW